MVQLTSSRVSFVTPFPAGVKHLVRWLLVVGLNPVSPGYCIRTRQFTRTKGATVLIRRAVGGHAPCRAMKLDTRAIELIVDSAGSRSWVAGVNQPTSLSRDCSAQFLESSI